MTDCDVAPTSSEVPHSIEGVIVNDKTTKARKRKKKKKKKKKKTTEPVSSDEDDFVPLELVNTVAKKTIKPINAASNMSTPQEVLRNLLVENDGYEANQVEQAMEQMWEKGLAFDEYDSVIRYLRSGNAMCGATESTACNSILTDSTNAEEMSSHGCLDVEEAAETTTSIATSIAPQDQKLEDNNCEQTENEEANGKEIEKESEKQPQEQEEEEASEEEKPPARPSMAKKLDTVASFENLTDAIFALTQWVTKAASNEEIEIFCRAEETSALPMVVRRGISSEIEDAGRFESAVQPGLVRLLMAVLKRCGLEASGELESKMEQMLKQARKVSLLTIDIDDENRIGGRISQFIVSRLTIAMDEMKKCNKNFTAVSDSLQDDQNMADLLSQRDHLKANAMRAYETVQSMKRSNEQSNDEEKAKTSFEMNDATLHIVDQETKNRFDNERSLLEKLKSQTKSETGQKLRDLKENMHSLEAKRNNYRDEIARLRAALEDLEAREKDTSLQIENLEAEIVEEQCKDDAKAKQLQEDIAQAKESVRYANLVSGLAGMMKTYGRSIEKATATKTGKVIQNNESEDSAISTEVSELNAMEDYLSKIRDYFLKEADCFTQLKHRLITKTAEIAALQSELEQYSSVKGLFSSSTVPTQVQQSIQRNQRLIQAYRQSLSTQKDAGRTTYEELLPRLHASSDVEGLFPSELLRGVPEAARVLEIDCDDGKLAPYVRKEERKSSKESANSTEPLPIAIQNAPAASSPYVAPKLSWASAKKASVPKKLSLLDIQKEELDQKVSA